MRNLASRVWDELNEYPAGQVVIAGETWFALGSGVMTELSNRLWEVRLELTTDGCERIVG